MSNRNPSLAISNGATPTGNGVDSYGATLGSLYLIVSAVGATPTITIIIEGSPDNTNWAALTGVTLTATGTGTTYKSFNEGHRYLRIRVTANTNVTATGFLTLCGFPYGSWKEN